MKLPSTNPLSSVLVLVVLILTTIATTAAFGTSTHSSSFASTAAEVSSPHDDHAILIDQEKTPGDTTRNLKGKKRPKSGGNKQQKKTKVPKSAKEAVVPLGTASPSSSPSSSPTSPQPTQAPTVDPACITQKSALLALKDGLINGDTTKLSDWDSAQDPCDSGSTSNWGDTIECTGGAVTRIDLSK